MTPHMAGVRPPEKALDGHILGSHSAQPDERPHAAVVRVNPARSRYNLV